MGRMVYLLEQGPMLGELSGALYPLERKGIAILAHHRIPIVNQLLEERVNAEEMQIALLSYFEILSEVDRKSSVVVAHIERTETVNYSVLLAQACLGIVLRIPNKDRFRFNFNQEEVEKSLSDCKNARYIEYYQNEYAPWVAAQILNLYGIQEQML